jgi:hypothetical protein
MVTLILKLKIGRDESRYGKINFRFEFFQPLKKTDFLEIVS